jgi:flavin-binding protein dodecin
MPEKVFKKITVTGCSDDSYEQAVKIAVDKASESLHGLAWFEVTELRGGILDDGRIEFQATVDVAFKVD